MTLSDLQGHSRSSNYHAQAIRHIRHLLMTDLAQTLACGLILSRIDYCHKYVYYYYVYYSSLFKCGFWYSCAAVDKISTDIEARSSCHLSVIAELLVRLNGQGLGLHKAEI